MQDVGLKANFRGKYPDQICRLCGNLNESHDHILTECTSNDFKVIKEDLFRDWNLAKLKEVAIKILEDKLDLLQTIHTGQRSGEPDICIEVVVPGHHTSRLPVLILECQCCLNHGDKTHYFLNISRMGYPGTGNWYIMHNDKLSNAMWYGTVYIVTWHIVHVSLLF